MVWSLFGTPRCQADQSIALNARCEGRLEGTQDKCDDLTGHWCTERSVVSLHLALPTQPGGGRYLLGADRHVGQSRQAHSNHAFQAGHGA
jgi:hypothetical protein